MSEDEAIKILTEYNNYTKIARSPYETDEALTILLERYKELRAELQQEKEKNNELARIKNGIKLLQNEGLNDEHYIIIANKNLKNTSYKHLLDDYIYKDKIKAKIEELEKQAENVRGLQGLRYSESGYIQSKINVLQELLEEN